MGDVGDAIMHAKALGSIKETSLVGVSSILTSEKEPMKETGESEAGLTTRVVEVNLGGTKLLGNGSR
ncbi:hypothetical protein ACOSP7_030859 [Xanthoceras sorbifolium]